MLSKPIVTLSASTALGVTLLGLSATLFAADVAGTLALERGRAAAANHAGAGVAAPSVASAVPPSEHAVRTAVLQAAPSHTRALLAVPAAVPAARPAVLQVAQRPRIARSQARPLAASHAVAARSVPTPIVAKHAAVARSYVAETAGRHARAPVARDAHDARLRPVRVAVIAVVAPLAARAVWSPPAGSNLVPLGDVRRFVMSQLKLKHKHVCVISSTTYAAADRHVVVDLVYRDDRGRWSAKAVVRRGSSAMKLMGVKQRPLPYRIIASSGFAPAP